MSDLRELNKVLERCAKPTEVRLGNKQHLKIIVGGRMVGVFPKAANNSSNNQTRFRNLVAAIKREDRAV